MDKVFPGLFYLPLKGQSSGGLRDRTTGTKRWTNKSNPAVTPHPLSIYNTPLGGASVVTRSEAVMSRGAGGVEGGRAGDKFRAVLSHSISGRQDQSSHQSYRQEVN